MKILVVDDSRVMRSLITRFLTEEVDEVFDIGVAFDADNDDAYRVRLCEQICRIEQYKRDVLLDEGRFLTSDEAAAEWIAEHAAAFP